MVPLDDGLPGIPAPLGGLNSRPKSFRWSFRASVKLGFIHNALRSPSCEPFVQGESSYLRRFQGAGLGLSTIARVVNLLGGGLSIESAAGEGTSVYVSIPFKMPSFQIKSSSSPSREVSLNSAGGVRILFAEDDAVTRLTVKKLLDKVGYQVNVAVDGRDAFRILEKDSFDLILMDIQMSKMDGIEATRAIRSQDRLKPIRGISIIALTAYAMTDDRENFIEAGMYDYIAKPVEMDTLKAFIERAMSQQSGPE